MDNIIQINLPASKSISNRVLILQYLASADFSLQNISDANDTILLQKCLQDIKNKTCNIIDCEDAGTVFRFLTSALSITKGNWILTGTKRMQERPIGTLVNTLRDIGAKITFLKKEGFPPIQIEGGEIEGGEIHIPSLHSSQFISSLMLIAPFLPKGLKIHINKNEIPSFPYVEITADVMRHFGLTVYLEDSFIEVPHSIPESKSFIIENDWSAASYFYESVALRPELKLSLGGLFEKSSQGDSIISKWFEELGVRTTYTNSGVLITGGGEKTNKFEKDFRHCPDLAQTFAVCCAALKIPATLSGLSSLRIKETDRLTALYNELNKINIPAVIKDDSLYIPASDFTVGKPIETYNDHRMAMAFAPLALLNKNIVINDKEVVRKSFPSFWDEFNKLAHK